jgi:hypothetical protein
MFSAESIGEGQRTPQTGYGYIDPEKLFLALNVASSNEFIGEEGALPPDPTPANPESHSEFFLVTLLLLPYRLIEFVLGILF